MPKKAKQIEHVPDPGAIAAQDDLELRLVLAIHDAIADISEALGCYLIDRYGSMHKARVAAERRRDEPTTKTV